LALVVLADWLFYERVVGWSLAIFAGAVLMVLMGRSPRLFGRRATVVLAVLAAGLLGALVEQPSVLAIALEGVGLSMVAILSHEAWTASVSQWVGSGALLILSPPLRLMMDQMVALRWLVRRPSARPAPVRIVGRWVVPVAGAGMFIGLFAVANPIVERVVRSVVDNLWTVFSWLPVVVTPERVALWIVVGMGVYGLLRYRRFSWLPRGAVVARPPVVARGGGDGGWIVRCLVAFNGVFLVQTGLDAVYLWGGAALPRGMTYAEYAHRGAYPLVATALLAGMFVLLTFRTGGTAQRSSKARALVYAWIGQNVLLLCATIARLWLYIDVYNLTRVRLAAVVWVGLVSLGFVWIVVKIARGRSNVWLWRVNVMTLAATLYAAAFWNGAGFIADFNVRHCREAGGAGAPLDVAYLEALGETSLPALGWVEPRVMGKQRGEVERAREALRRGLAEELSDWRGWSWRRGRLSV
jgi:hypothetical protein